MHRIALFLACLLAGPASAEEPEDTLWAISRGLDTAVAMATTLTLNPIGVSCDASADELARVGFGEAEIISYEAKGLLIQLSRGLATTCWRHPSRLEKLGLLYLAREALDAPAEGGTLLEMLDARLGTTWAVTRNRL